MNIDLVAQAFVPKAGYSSISPNAALSFLDDAGCHEGKPQVVCQDSVGSYFSVRTMKTAGLC